MHASADCVDPEPPCGRCDPCVANVLRGAERRLTAVYGQPVQLGMEGPHVIATPSGLPPRRPRRVPAPPEDARHVWARALWACDDPEARSQIERQQTEATQRAFADELVATARRWGATAARGQRACVSIAMPSGAEMAVRVRDNSYAVGPRSHTLSGLAALRSAVVAELALDGRLSPERPGHQFVGRLIAGEAPRLEPWAAGLVERLGLMAPDPQAAWLRAQIEHYLQHGPTAGGLGSPVATAGVSYRGGRLVSIDGVPLRHVDANALCAWRLWALERARGRQHPQTGHLLPVTWRPVTWGPPVDAGAGLVVRDGPEPVQVLFDRHRRMYARRARPPDQFGNRPPTDWGRAGTPIPAEAPRRSRGRARELYEVLARHWLVGWSLSELARASGVPRTAVGRLMRHGVAVSAVTRKALRHGGTIAYTGRWLAVTGEQVITTASWEDTCPIEASS